MKILSKNLFIKLVAAFGKPPMTLKMNFESHLRFNVSKACNDLYTRENQLILTFLTKVKPDINSDEVSECYFH
jgi:hypothetical protein